MIKILYTSIFVLFLFAVQAQKNIQHHKKMLRQADDAFDRSNYLKAYHLYSEIVKEDSLNYELIYKSGVCLFAVNKTDTNCLKFFRRSKHAVAESHFYMGRVLLIEGQTRKALEEFYEFKEKNTEASIGNLEVLHWISICEAALKEEARKHTLIVRNLGEQINTSFSEYVPLIWNINGALVFTSRRSDSKGGLKDPYGRFYEDIYISRPAANGWGSPESISDQINTETHDACVAFSPSGNELLIYRTDEKQTGGDLYISRYDSSKWSVPEKLGPEINSPYLETSACFSSSGNEIIFSSNRPGGHGGRDLYIVRRFMNGKFSLPYNLGKNINTAEDEDAPFIDKNNNNLYFSSKGHNTIGEYDIFMAEYNPDLDQWKAAENLGMPVNSTTDDIFFTKLDDKNVAMFTSRRDGGFGDADIYQVNFDESSQVTVYCRLNLSDARDKSALKDLQLSLYDAESGKLEGIFRPSKEYASMVLVADVNKLYKIIVEGTGIEPLIQKNIFDGKEKDITINLLLKNK